MREGFEQLAAWIIDFRAKRPPQEAMAQAKLALLDSLGCMLAARAEDTVSHVLDVIDDLGGAEQARIIGTHKRSSVTHAVFVNGVMIRLLDFNDFSGGTTIGGHPSDNISVALAVGDWRRSSGLDVLTSIVMAYELYGRLQDQLDGKSPWDHVTASGIVAPAVAGFLMDLDLNRLSHALALSSCHCPTLGAIRRGHLSAAKNMANAAVAQAAVFQTLLAAQGLTGPLTAMEGPRGLNATVLARAGYSALLAPVSGRHRIMDTQMKAFPCVGTAQSLVAAALQVRPRVAEHLDKIEAIKVTMAELPSVASQVVDIARRYPSSREAADHSFSFLPVVALLDGELTARQFENCRWEDHRVKELMNRITIGMDRDLNERAPNSLPARIAVKMASGEEHTAFVPYPPGHPQNRLGEVGIIGKFARYNGLTNPPIDWQALARAVTTIDSVPDLDGLLRMVCGKD